jgi:hypothetical protein
LLAKVPSSRNRSNPAVRSRSAGVQVSGNRVQSVLSALGLSGAAARVCDPGDVLRPRLDRQVLAVAGLFEEGVEGEQEGRRGHRPQRLRQLRAVVHQCVDLLREHVLELPGGHPGPQVGHPQAENVGRVQQRESLRRVTGQHRDSGAGGQTGGSQAGHGPADQVQRIEAGEGPVAVLETRPITGTVQQRQHGRGEQTHTASQARECAA